MKFPFVRTGLQTFLFILGFAVSLALAHAALPSVQPLVRSGKWPGFARGSSYDVKVAGNYAYVALGSS